jgi:hypothetical protein
MSNKMNEALRVLARRGKVLLERADSPIDYDHPADVEPHEEVWSGGENIELELDIAHVHHGADEQVTEPEVMSIVELRKFVLEQLGKGRGLPGQEFAQNQAEWGAEEWAPGVPHDPEHGMKMEMMIEDLLENGDLFDDVQALEDCYDYIEANNILDTNDLSLHSAGPSPADGHVLEYFGPVTLEQYTGN